MAEVDLGYSRNPSDVGTKGLLAIANKEKVDYKIVDFDYYEDGFESFKELVRRRTGFVGWVVGERGTGKSEALARIFLDIIAENPEEPPLPIYVSVTEGEVREKVANVGSQGISMALFNYACREALKEALLHIRERGKGNFFKVMRGTPALSDEKAWNTVVDYLSKDDFSINHFMDSMGKKMRLCICLDDLDKFPPATVHDFFSANQTDLQRLTGTHNVALIGSVEKRFTSEYRGEGSVNWCLPPAGSRELRIPDLSDLTASDIQDFIDHRIAHLHFDDSTSQWIFRPDREPNKENGIDSAAIVIDDPRWNTFDTRKMRQNGSMIVLNAWMAHDGNMSLRAVLENLAGVLSSRSARKDELTGPVLQRLLKENNNKHLEAMREELQRMCIEKGVSVERLRREEELLNSYGSASSFWKGMMDISKDMITLGVEEGPAFKSLNKKYRHFSVSGIKEKGLGFHIKDICGNFGKEPSAVYEFMCISRDLSVIEPQDYLPEIVSRTPQEIFGSVKPRQLEIWVNKLSTDLVMELLEVEDLEDSNFEDSDDRTNLESLDSDADGFSEDIVTESLVFNAYRAAAKKQKIQGFSRKRIDDARQKLLDLSEEDKMTFGEDLAFQIFHYYVGVGDEGLKDLQWTGVSGSFNKALKADPRGLAKALVSWAMLRCNLDQREDVEALMALEDSVLNRGVLRLLDHESHFGSIIEQEPRSPRLQLLEREFADVREDLAHNTGFEIRLDRGDDKLTQLKTLANRVTQGMVPLLVDETITLQVNESVQSHDSNGVSNWFADSLRVLNRINAHLSDSDSKLNAEEGGSWGPIKPIIDDEMVNGCDELYSRAISRMELTLSVDCRVRFLSEEKIVWLSFANSENPLFSAPIMSGISWKAGSAVLPKYDLLNPFLSFKTLKVFFISDKEREKLERNEKEMGEAKEFYDRKAKEVRSLQESYLEKYLRKGKQREEGEKLGS